MEGQNRRLERNKGVLHVLEQRFAIKDTIDLSPLEQQNLFLEGTGGMVLDREHRISYACHSGAPTNALRQFAEPRLPPVPVPRRRPPARADLPQQRDDERRPPARRGVPRRPAPRRRAPALEHSLRDTGKHIWPQLRPAGNFAGNMLEVHDRDGRSLLVMSASAWRRWTPPAPACERHTPPVVVNIDNIERIGGGSARCMLAEVHLPPRLISIRSLAATRYIDVNDLSYLVSQKGLQTCLTEMAEYIRADYLRWQDFEKCPRLANHSPDGVIELMPVSDAAVRLQVRQRPPEKHPQRPAHGDGLRRPGRCRHRRAGAAAK
jgi:hypothetical protein